MKFYRIVLICIFISTRVFGQQNSKQDSLSYYFNKGYQFYYTNPDSLYYYFDKVERIAQHDDLDYLVLAYIYESWSANYFYDFNTMKTNIKKLDSIVLNVKDSFKTIPDNHVYTIQIDYTKGLYHFETSDFLTSKKYFKKVVLATEKLNDTLSNTYLSKLLVESNNHIAKMYDIEQKNTLAREFYNNTIRYLIDKNLNRQLYNTKSLLSDNYKKSSLYAKSNALLKQVLPYYKKKKENNNRLLSIYSNLIDNYVALSKVDSAKVFLKNMKKNLTENHPLAYRYHLAKSKIYQFEGDYEFAEKELKKVLAIKQQQWQKPQVEIADAYYKIGKLNGNFNAPEKALKSFNNALDVIGKIEKSIKNKTLAFKILKDKAATLNTLKKHLQVIETVEKAVTILDELKPTFKTNQDKLFLIDNAFPLFKNGLKATYTLYKEKQDETFLRKAFEFSEKSKSVLLLESILASKATSFANIPKKIIEQEKQFKAKITGLEKRINQKPTDRLKNELFNVNKDYIEFVETIEKNYKNYYNLKYNTEVITYEKVQKKLANNQIAVSYFYGNEAIYLLAISKKNTAFEKLKIDNDLEKSIISFQEMLSNPKSDLKKLKITAALLYQNLLQPVLKEETPSSLLIIPDGLLNYIPFESLVSNNQYLIENIAISYINSATLLAQLQQENESNDLLAFAPVFSGESVNLTDRSKLLPLPHNAKEVSNITPYFEGKAFVNKEATLANFNQNNSDFSIIHLATHGVFEDQNSEYSYLAFTSEENKDNLLYVRDIYNSKLNANLVTLSACETSIGDLQRGEGFISLSRSFYYAGAASIVGALWKVNDASTATLMKDFYKNLSEGKDKATALQESKVNFIKLNKENNLVHPFYWSGFILSGNNEPLINSNYKIWILSGLLMLVLGYFLYRRKY